MGEIENFIERENRFKGYCFVLSAFFTFGIILNAVLHDYSGELIYLFLMVGSSVSAIGFFVLAYLIQAQNKIIGILGFIIEGIQEEGINTDVIVKKIIPQFKKILDKELK